ncbi:7TM domain-containing protein [Patescibacteria group bacterium]
MRKSLFKLSIFLCLFILTGFIKPVLSIEKEEASSNSEAVESMEDNDKLATEAAKEATPSSIVEIIVEKKEDITEPTPEIKGKLERYLAEHPPSPLNITNFLQHAIRNAVKNGVPANTIVLILLFPLIAAIIAASRHIIGIRGFGIFLPAVLSVVFVATGIIEGLLLFLMIIIVATSARMMVRKLKIEYLPRMALLLWFVCLGVLASLFLSPALNLATITTLSIFPILILILLTENFISIHIGMSMKQAVSMTFETLVIALICSFLLQMDFLQKFVLLYPEVTVLGVAVFDLFMGKYVGLRWFEYKKFKNLLK